MSALNPLVLHAKSIYHEIQLVVAKQGVWIKRHNFKKIETVHCDIYLKVINMPFHYLCKVHSQSSLLNKGKKPSYKLYCCID